jgi:hypothetical protein
MFSGNFSMVSVEDAIALARWFGGPV